jgi:nicotinamidase-related amidase
MTGETLSSESTVFLLIDHQTGVFARVVKVPPREQVEANVLRLARGRRAARHPHHPHHQ